jgi:hypothetical protein
LHAENTGCRNSYGMVLIGCVETSVTQMDMGIKFFDLITGQNFGQNLLSSPASIVGNIFSKNRLRISSALYLDFSSINFTNNQILDNGPFRDSNNTIHPYEKSVSRENWINSSLILEVKVIYVARTLNVSFRRLQ